MGHPDTSGVGGLGLLPPPWLELGPASSVLALCLALVWECLPLSRLSLGWYGLRSDGRSVYSWK